MPPQTWIDELRAGHGNEALEILHREAPSPSNSYSLGAVYMWVGEFQSALTHFQKHIDSPPPYGGPGDFAFGMAGSAAWCLGHIKLAIKHWKKGRKAASTIGAANTRTALLLYAAAVLKPEAYSIEKATDFLTQRTSQWRIKNWPGPVAEFILGHRDEASVREKAVFRGTTMQAHNHKNYMSWQVDFYKLLTLVASRKMELSELEREFQPLVQVRGSAYLDRSNFFYFLRLEEFYLARQWTSRHA